MLNVVLQDNLKTYLKQHHHDEVSLRIIRTNFTIGDVDSLEPHVYLEAPQNLEDYDTYLVDGVKVYVEKKIEAYDDTIELFEDKFLGVHRCHVFGVKLDN
jgi:hypothetical protein